MEFLKIGFLIVICAAFVMSNDAKTPHQANVNHGKIQRMPDSQMPYFIHEKEGGCDCNNPSCQYNCPPESDSFCCTEGREGYRRCCPNDFPNCCMTDSFVQYCCPPKEYCCDSFCCRDDTDDMWGQH